MINTSCSDHLVFASRHQNQLSIVFAFYYSHFSLIKMYSFITCYLETYGIYQKKEIFKRQVKMTAYCKHNPNNTEEK